jgi:protocatechuate 3,4-dioxygenase beta subunit
MTDPDPPYRSPAYTSTALRAPARPLVLPPLGPESVEASGPVFGHHELGPLDHDLTRQRGTEPQGERVIVTGRVRDGAGRPVPAALVEIWQANAAGRYAHASDLHPAPLDPGFAGTGRCLTDDDGRYLFVTIKPGAYPWHNHHNAWRPAHIHFSVFGTAFTQRLVTQMYFPGDPLLAHDPIFSSVPGWARARLIADLDLDTAAHDWALGYRWDIVLGATPAAT